MAAGDSMASSAGDAASWFPVASTAAGRPFCFLLAALLGFRYHFTALCPTSTSYPICRGGGSGGTFSSPSLKRASHRVQRILNSNSSNSRGKESTGLETGATQ